MQLTLTFNCPFKWKHFIKKIMKTFHEVGTGRKGRHHPVWSTCWGREQSCDCSFDVEWPQAGQLCTAAPLLQMTNNVLPLGYFPSAASGVQSALPQMALELEGCPTLAGTHQFICLLAEPRALQKHRLCIGSYLKTFPSQENTHFSFKQTGVDWASAAC